MSVVGLVAFCARVSTRSVGPAVLSWTFFLSIFVLILIFSLVVIVRRLLGFQVFELLEKLLEEAGSGGIGDVGLLDGDTPGVGAAITCRRGFGIIVCGTQGKGMVVVTVGARRIMS